MRYDALYWLPRKTNKLFPTIPISFRPFLISFIQYSIISFQMTVTAVRAFIVLCFFATLSINRTTLQFPHKIAASVLSCSNRISSSRGRSFCVFMTHFSLTEYVRMLKYERKLYSNAFISHDMNVNTNCEINVSSIGQYFKPPNFRRLWKY